MFKKTALGVVSGLTIAMVTGAPVFAATQTSQATILVSTTTSSSTQSFVPSQAAQDFLGKMISSGLINEFSFDQNGKLTLNDSISDLASKYNLNSSDVANLQAIINAAQSYGSESTSSSKTGIQPQLSYSGGTVYFSHDDVDAYLFAAASVGPAALMAALDALATLTGGPVGAGLSLILDVLGASSLAGFTYMCVQAEYNGQGVYIGLTWNGVFPNISYGFWK
ncbi:hypothetical protein [Alicyclobacillus suci]|uniref:hypothetical protein n=1 Tax=Alicyclobacillus suci TaxID=2816080 RepID=UPI001A8EB8C3|nr:hypothetical protein [Alicyclobacillus suci]